MAMLIERFVAKVSWPAFASACWLWAAGVDRDGYGRILVGRSKGFAHRASYELFRGPIPEGLHIDHLCRVRKCVNPAHLEAVPKVLNDLRGESPQAVNARKTHCSSGHEFTAANTYRWVGRRQRENRACRICRDAATRRYRDRRAEAAQ